MSLTELDLKIAAEVVNEWRTSGNIWKAAHIVAALRATPVPDEDEDDDPSCPGCWASWQGAHICAEEDLARVRRHAADLRQDPA